MSHQSRLGATERRRYARHLSLAGFGEKGQETLLDAHVLIVGAGGLGSPVVSYLAACGVGHLTLVDPDAVDVSNLARQVVHTEVSVGSAKVDSVRSTVGAQNSGVCLEGVERALDIALALELVPLVDVVVDCTDSVEVRYILNDACVLLGVPLVWASIDRFAGQLGVVLPEVGPCYRCAFPSPASAAGVLTCEAGGVLGVLPGVMGTLQATEVVKLLTGLGRPASGGVRYYDALAADMVTVPLVRDAACAACGRGRYFEGVDGVVGDGERASDASLWAELADTDSGSVVLDVRDAHEVAAEPLPRWVASRVERLPWGSGWGPGDVAEAVSWVPRGEGGVLVVCASGKRSRAAAASLRAAGVDAWSVSGGVAALPATLAPGSSDFGSASTSSKPDAAAVRGVE